MNAVELIIKKRDGKTLTESEIDFMVMEYTRGNLPDYQFSAFLMAAFLNGLNRKETASLTRSMLFSGKVIGLGFLKGMKIDKHSSGGVGDKTSLILAPVVAAAGIYVPMISGRGLGHTGGTLDKLESIPGFRTRIGLNEYKSIIKKCGLVLAGQTKDVVPADKLIYSLRDVTGTVESIPLITASIMSKKLAEGIDGLVLDIKVGNGAFMKTIGDATELANSLISTARAFKKKVAAFITDMNQPLGHYIGNWLEVLESIKILKGEFVPDLSTVTLTLSGAMIYLGGKAASLDEGIEISLEMIRSGKAFDKFVEMVKLQGGDVSYILKPEKYPKSKHHIRITAPASGYLKSVDNYQIGISALLLGAGRIVKEDVIDPKAGIVFHPKIGNRIKKGDPIADLYTDRKDVLKSIEEKILKSVKIVNEKTTAPKLIKKIIL